MKALAVSPDVEAKSEIKLRDESEVGDDNIIVKRYLLLLVHFGFFMCHIYWTEFVNFLFYTLRDRLLVENRTAYWLEIDQMSCLIKTEMRQKLPECPNVFRRTCQN